MTKYREILQLKHLGFSERNIARTAGVSRNTVKRVVEVAAAAKIDWTHAESMDYATIENTLFPDKETAQPSHSIMGMLTLLNTTPGSMLFESVADKVVQCESKLEYAIAGNPCIVCSSKQHPKRAEFFAD